MQELLSLEFFQNALLASLLLSIATGIIGSLIAVNRMTFLAGGIAHASYGGIGMAVFFGLPIFFGTSLFAVFIAIVIAGLSLKNRHDIDSLIGVVWAVGMAVGIVFVDKTSGYKADLLSYLFGSIMAVTKADIYYMSAIVVAIMMSVGFWYRKLLAVSFDMEYAKLLGINTNFFYTLILVLASLTIVISIKVVGLILVIALLSIPTFIAKKLSSSLFGMMVVSTLLSIFFTIAGLFLSYYLDISSGASIILTGAFVLVVFLGIVSRK